MEFEPGAHDLCSHRVRPLEENAGLRVRFWRTVPLPAATHTRNLHRSTLPVQGTTGNGPVQLFSVTAAKEEGFLLPGLSSGAVADSQCGRNLTGGGGQKSMFGVVVFRMSQGM